jgi:cyanophycin synthetase
VDTLDELAAVKRVVVEVATDTAVLNADDARVLRMADYTEARHVCYVTMNPQHSLVRDHIHSGGRAVVLEAGIAGLMITIYDHGAHIPLLWAHRIPATIEGKATHNVQNAMFAAALAFAMGVRLEDIRHGLQTFETSYFQAPGRGNIYNEHPFKVILDYGHNAAAVEAMCQLARRLEVEAGGCACWRHQETGATRTSAPSPRSRRSSSSITTSASATTTRAAGGPTRCRGCCATASWAPASRTRASR